MFAAQRSIAAELRAYFNLPPAPPPRNEDLENLKTVCTYLNLRKRVLALLSVKGEIGDSPDEIATFSQSLRALVEEWRSSGPNTEVMKQENPSLWEKIEHVTITIKPTSTGAAKIEPVGIPRENQGLTDAESLLYAFFLMLIMNPLWERLGGPCARCNNFYIKKTKRQKAYCSKRCGKLSTSVDCNRKRRHAQHLEKVERAKRFIVKWQAFGSKGDWKMWVSSKAGITSNWLTRSLNAREISDPTKQDCQDSTVTDLGGE
ncbi:MAG: hypothetical protein WCF30_17535 [Terracidiphilus sp.]